MCYVLINDTYMLSETPLGSFDKNNFRFLYDVSDAAEAFMLIRNECDHNEYKSVM